MNVLLLSTPWPLFNRPSIQLGTLTAFVQGQLPHIQVTACHAYLSVAVELGYDLYREISERTWPAESIYAALLYPERLDEISRFWRRRSRGCRALRSRSFTDICARTKAASDAILGQLPLNRVDLVGLSICLGQLTSSLYFIQEMKKRIPSLQVVVGGAACAGQLGESLLANFSAVDFVIQGEGELPLTGLIRSLMESGAVDRPIAGLLPRSVGQRNGVVDQVSQMDDLPVPDYGEYFDRLRSLGPQNLFLPRLPMEISRGCWWRKPAIQGEAPSGCTFCNLNLQWEGYRAKSLDRVVQELNELVQRHQILSLSFMDNLLPARGMDDLFQRIGELKKDLRLFAEIRATTVLDTLRAMKSGGMDEVQVGIEALSSSLLKKLNKGTTALDNIEIMRDCEREDTPSLTGNLILDFPSGDEQDVAETMNALPFVFPFRPLKGIPFWLGYGSPVWHAPKQYGITRVGNHPHYKHLFPPEVLRHLRLMIQGYQGGVRNQSRLWKPVRKVTENWRRSYEELHRKPGFGPILSYQDGGSFMIIRQRRPGKDDMTHRLSRTSRKIYLFCSRQRDISEIVSEFPGFGEEKILPFLRLMVDKKVMFCDGNRWLSLAVASR